MLLIFFAATPEQKAAYEEFAQLLAPIQGRLYAFIRTVLREGYAADDVFQDTIESALRNWKGLRDPERFKSWLFTIAKNKAMDELRRRKRKPTEALPENDLLESDEDVEILVVQKEQERRLLEAIRGLEPENARILALRHFHGLRYTEIARITGMSEGALRTRHKRLLARLRQVLTEKEGFHAV